MQIIAEDGTPSVSYENAFKMASMHGPVVAVSHIITPRNEHVTKLFFLDGKSHTAFGFALGNEEGSEHSAKVLGLIMTLQTIWSVDMGSIMEKISTLGTEEDTAEAFGVQKNIVYHFTAPESNCFMAIIDSPGMLAFTDSVELLEEDENETRIID